MSDQGPVPEHIVLHLLRGVREDISELRLRLGTLEHSMATLGQFVATLGQQVAALGQQVAMQGTRSDRLLLILERQDERLQRLEAR